MAITLARALGRHSIGLRMGWYGNNCGCNEHQAVPSWGPAPGGNGHDGVHHYQGDIQATVDFGFDGIKLDGCGEFRNLTYFAELMNRTGRQILVEDCHWGGDGQSSTHYYIMSGEVIGFRLFWATRLAFAIRPKDGVARYI